jgi:hypothetical protein
MLGRPAAGVFVEGVVRQRVFAAGDAAQQCEALAAGLDGNLGAPRSAVLTEMTRTAAAMAPHRPADEHAHVASHVLDRLLRHVEANPHLARRYGCSRGAIPADTYPS